MILSNFKGFLYYLLKSTSELRGLYCKILLISLKSTADLFQKIKNLIDFFAIIYLRNSYFCSSRVFKNAKAFFLLSLKFFNLFNVRFYIHDKTAETDFYFFK